MNEELQAAITDVINSMMGVAGSAYQLGAEQMPEVVEQLLRASIISHWIFLAAWGLLFLAISGVLVAALFSRAEEAGAVIFFGLPGFLVGVTGVIYNVYYLIRIYIAPKVWLIEYAAGLVK